MMIPTAIGGRIRRLRPHTDVNTVAVTTRPVRMFARWTRMLLGEFWPDAAHVAAISAGRRQPLAAIASMVRFASSMVMLPS